MILRHGRKHHSGTSGEAAPPEAERGSARILNARDGSSRSLRRIYARSGLPGLWRFCTHRAGLSWRTAWRIYRRFGVAMLWRKLCLKILHLRIAALSPADYLRHVMPSRRELARQRRDGKLLAEKIHFAVVWPSAGRAAELETFSRALRAQSFSGWTLLVPSGREAGAAAGPVLPYDGPNGLPRAWEACGCTHVLWAESGTTLFPHALFELAEYLDRHPGTGLVYTDDAWYETAPHKPYFIHGKPDFSEITLCSGNYIGLSWCASRRCLEAAKGYDNSFDALWRAIETAGGAAHLPRVLCARRGCRAAGDPVAARRTDRNAERSAIAEHLRRSGRPGQVEALGERPFFRVTEAHDDMPPVSILIPSKDQAAVLRRCVESILKKSSWRNFEIVIVENGSCEPATEAFYREIAAQERVRVVRYPRETVFNYSKVNNFGAAQCHGEYIVFMNNDMEVISPSWIEELLLFGRRPEVGAVGAKLYFPDDTVQHGGVLVGYYGAADHLFLGCGRRDTGYAGQLLYARECTAVTFACCLVRKSVFEQLGGLNEEFALSFNDVDFCLRLRASGRRVVWTPFAELYHHESLSRGYDVSEAQSRRLEREIGLLRRQWPEARNGEDPFYNANLSLLANDCRLRHPLEKRLLAATREWTARCMDGGGRR